MLTSSAQNIAATSHNSLTVLFEGISWDRLKHVFVDREGEHIYALRPKVDKVVHRLLCDVKLVENVKVVTFRSTFLIENKSLVNAEMVIVDEHGKKASQIYKIREPAHPKVIRRALSLTILSLSPRW